ncbi:sensor histidine kinase [Virgibacillus sp. NKC19-3]|uniref:sensor histidine kinase n=1 Tax=Virgibacillus saliphilus TaxID=2831674 RepID=UPI001C9A9F29|nr:sensor histidine kinase [Virgibacillus sp. NKC19-3]MBY7142889.1 sensor histidine kinase [Virgibacillus sp. NKC19-3]
MKTIRGKLLVYFFAFVLLFQVTAVSIFVSSNELTNSYDDSFQRFLLLNAISQKSEELYMHTGMYVTNAKAMNEIDYFKTKNRLENEIEQLENAFDDSNAIEIKNYINLIESFMHESELTVGFVLQDDIENYTYHLEETRIASEYIQASTLEIIDVELTAYQALYQDLQLRNEHFMLFIIFLFITTVMLAICFALWFSKGITQPIHKLAYAAKEVSEGNLLGEPINIQSTDELKLLGDTFHNMRSNIHGLVEEIKDQSELDQLVKEMELKHLQNQMNPHFLFNTLNTISKMAYLEDAKSTSRLIDAVAGLLRHNLGQMDTTISLRNEVEVVKNYFHIQKIRFSERIRFEWNIDENCLEIEVPRLILQPLVENAFIHGIEENENGGAITLQIYELTENIIIEVQDDGAGMKQDTVKRLLSLSNLEEVHVGHSTGIGLTNVIRRLQLHYQLDHVVEIESEQGEGTTIRLVLPKK